MLNIACVCVGPAYSNEYVEILYSMVRRNLAGGTRGRFVVFTDDPSRFTDMAGVETRQVPADLKGWWAKLYLFSPDAFPKGERVLYFDLDTVITGPLDEIAAYDGPFAILRDAYRPDGLQSSVMAWEAGTCMRLWDHWNACGRPEIEGGDQIWIEQWFDQSGYFQPEVMPGYDLLKVTCSPDIWQNLFPRQFRSYKVDCTDYVPKGTNVVFFHGRPRPHEAGGWVPSVWKIGESPLFFASNTKEDELRRNITHALTKERWIERRDGTPHPAIIVGGGPSLARDLWRIKGYQLSGGVVFATNNTWRFLKDNGISADAHVMHDARFGNLPFMPDDATPCYYASQCHPEVLDTAGPRLICWHPYSEIALEVIGESEKGPTMVAGGSTVGLNAIALAYILGHRQFLLFGLDSSYEDTHHAYPQSLNDGELVLEVQAHGQTFRAAPWMVQQAEQFMELARNLISYGCEVSVYGEGLLPTMARAPSNDPPAAELRARALHAWLKDMPHPVGAEIGVFAGELSRRLLSRPDLTLYLVDSWTTQHEKRYADSGDFHASLTQAQQDRVYQMTQHMVGFAGERARILRQDSREAAKAIPDASLDFVFIDADHSYEGCKADIDAWLPKIKPGGFISGHDYENTDFPKFGVKRAVDERFAEVTLGENFTWFRRIE